MQGCHRDRPRLHPVRQALVDTLEPLEQFNRFLIALAEHEDGGGRTKEHLVKSKAQDKPRQAKLARLEDDALLLGAQLTQHGYLRRPEGKTHPIAVRGIEDIDIAFKP